MDEHTLYQLRMALDLGPDERIEDAGFHVIDPLGVGFNRWGGASYTDPMEQTKYEVRAGIRPRMPRNPGNRRYDPYHPSLPPQGRTAPQERDREYQWPQGEPSRSWELEQGTVHLIGDEKAARLVCQECGDEFTIVRRATQSRPWPKYCSDPCAKDADRRKARERKAEARQVKAEIEEIVRRAVARAAEASENSDEGHRP